MAFTLPGGKRDLIKKAGSRIFVTVSISAVVTAFCLVAINYMWDQAVYNNRVHTEKELAKETLLDNLSKVSALQESFLALNASENLIGGQGDKSNAAVILDALPRKYDFPALITSIDKLAKISGVKVTALNGIDEESTAVSKATSPTPIEIRIAVTIGGDYATVNEFIKNIGRTIRPLEIESIRFSGSNDKMSVALKLITFYQPTVDLAIETVTVKELEGSTNGLGDNSQQQITIEEGETQ